MVSFFYFGVEIEVIVEPHNKGQPVQERIPETLDAWYEKLAKALRRRRGTDHRLLRVTAEKDRKKQRQSTDRHLQWWITWDGSLIAPAWPKHPGGTFVFYFTTSL